MPVGALCIMGFPTIIARGLIEFLWNYVHQSCTEAPDIGMISPVRPLRGLFAYNWDRSFKGALARRDTHCQ